MKQRRAEADDIRQTSCSGRNGSRDSLLYKFGVDFSTPLSSTRKHLRVSIGVGSLTTLYKSPAEPQRDRPIPLKGFMAAPSLLPYSAPRCSLFASRPICTRDTRFKMPRSTPPRTVTLLLPSIASSSSSSSTTAMSARQTPQVDFEVLIHTQKLAAESGQFFDIMSFMTPAQQKRYLTSLAPYQPLPQSTSIPNSVPVPPDPTPKRPAEVVPESGIVLEPGQPAIPPIVIPPLESPTLPPPKKPRPQPDLSHLHWKQRQKRLAMIASGEIGEDSDLFIEKDREGPGTSLGISQHEKKGEIDREAIQSSASYWCVGVLSSCSSSREDYLATQRVRLS